mgnify:CR=1 FL=1
MRRADRGSLGVKRLDVEGDGLQLVLALDFQLVEVVLVPEDFARLLVKYEAVLQNGEDGLPIPPYRVYNIGNNSPENLLDFVGILSEELVLAKVLPEDYDFESHKKLVPMQAGDVPITYADTEDLERDFGFKPSTTLREGLRKFAEWYHGFYQ